MNFVITLALPLLISCYSKHSAQDALSECTRCLESLQNRFCTDGTSYYCCDMAENSMFCDPTEIGKIIQGPEIRCSHTKYG